MSDPADRIVQLRKRLIEVVARAPELGEVLRGTVRQRHVRCGKKGCHCQDGEGHGPVFYLSVSRGAGRTEQATLTPETYPLAQRYADNYAKLKDVLEEVSDINREILREQRRARRLERRDSDGK